jgi:hypothetical protein
MLELLSDNVDVVLSMDAFNDRLLLFLLSFMSFSLLTLLLSMVEFLMSFDGDEISLIVLVSIIACRDGNDMLRIFSSCLRSKKDQNYLRFMLQFSLFIFVYLALRPSIAVN